MKTIIKIVAAIVIIVGLFLGGAALLLVKTVNPNDYKTQISQFIKEKTGRDLTIQGNIGWSFFPLFGVKAHGISLGNSANFAPTDFMKVGELDVKILPFSLFTGKTAVSEIILKDCVLNLIKNQNGESNWQDLLDSVNAVSNEKVKIVEPATQYRISNLVIKNATVTYDNQQMDKSITINNLNLVSENVNPNGEQFYINADANFLNTVSNLNGHASLSGNAILDLHKKVYELQSLQILGDLNGGNLRNKIDFAANANINADLENQTLNFDNLSFKLDNLVATGKIQATNISYAPNVVGNLSAAPFNPRPLLMALGLVNGKNTNVFNNASFKLAMQTTSKFLKISDLELTLDDSKISGVASYSHFTDKYVIFNLDANKIDLDRYLSALPPSTENVAKQKSAQTPVVKSVVTANANNPQKIVGSSSTDSTLLKILLATRLTGDIQVGDIKFNKMHFSNVKAQINGDFGNINLKPVDFNLYHGSSNLAINIDVRKTIPQYMIASTFSNVAVQPLFKDMANSDKISGIANLQANLSMHGNDVNSLTKTLNGHGKLTLIKGVFHGIDLRYQVDRARSLLSLVKGNAGQLNIANLLQTKKVDVKPETNPPRTDFGQLTATFNLHNGILSTNDMLINASYFTAKGKGTADINSQQLNFLIEATNDRQDFYVPVRITNTFSDPKITPEISAMTKNVLQNAVKVQVSDKNADKVKKQIDKLGDKSPLIKSLDLNKKLNKLLGKP